MILSRIVLSLSNLELVGQSVCFDVQYLVERSAIVIGLSQICLHKRRHLLCVFTFSGSISFFSKNDVFERDICVCPAKPLGFTGTKLKAQQNLRPRWPPYAPVSEPCIFHIDIKMIHKYTNTQMHQFTNTQIQKHSKSRPYFTLT